MRITGVDRWTFRATTAADLPLLHEWLNEPGIVRWWEGDDVSWSAVQRDYGPDRDDGTEQYLALVDGEPLGWIQWYHVADSPQEHGAWQTFGVTEADIGIDYFIADPAQRHRGIGSMMIDRFVLQIVMAQGSGALRVCASPVAANRASVRALAKAGFTERGRFADSISGTCVLMARTLSPSEPTSASPMG